MQLDIKKKSIIKDSITNIIAAAIPIVLLQLIVFPQLARIKGDIIYGFIVTIVSVMTLFSESYGNILNNVRLLNGEKSSKQGDFNLILILGCVYNIIAVLIGCMYYGADLVTICGVVIASVLILLRAYYIVAFRIIISYKNVLINNIVLSIGYLTGFLLFLLIDYWFVIYIVGNAFSLIHLCLKSSLMKEPFIKTDCFKRIFKKFSILYIAEFLRVFITYADRLLIFPILGEQAVAYYYAASVMGKMMSMGITPVSSVILSYVVKEKELKKQTINKILGILMILLLAGFTITYIVGRILLKILYGTWFEMTIGLLPWTVLAALLGGAASVIHPFVLKFKNELYQIAINALNLVVYVAISIFLSRQYGLLGFCVGYCLTMAMKLIISVCLMRSISGEDVN